MTITVRDYDAGYPPNRYYGQTCVGRMEQEEFTLTLDRFNEWEAQGRLTPNMNTTKCQPNPAAGVSSIPLSSLGGSAAPAGQIAAAPAPPPNQAGGGADSGVVAGVYECWSSNRANLTLNFTIRGPGGSTLGTTEAPGRILTTRGRNGSASTAARSRE